MPNKINNKRDKNIIKNPSAPGIKIKPDFIARLEKLAAKKGVSCEEMIAAALKEYLSREETEK